MLQPGTVLRETYEIERVLEPGTIETTYLATRRDGAGRVVVKAFHPTSLTPARRETAARHVAQMKAMSHPGLPRVLDLVDGDEALFLVQEHVEGASLQSLVLREALPVPQLVSWTSSLCDALSYLHTQEHPMTYHALRPDGIVVDAEGIVRLAEFGAAHVFDDATRASWVLHAASCMGFAAPESYQSDAADDTADVYSVAAVLYFAITRMLPPSAMLRKAGIELEPATSFSPDLSPGIEAALTRALDPSPGMRFSSVRELERALTGEACPRCSRDRSPGATICLMCGTEMAPVPVITRPRPVGTSSGSHPMPTAAAPVPAEPAATVAEPVPETPPVEAPPPPTPPPPPPPPDPPPVVEVPAAAPEPPPVLDFLAGLPVYHLRVLEGAEKGRTVEIPRNSVELGRKEADSPPERLTFREPTISRLQAYLRYDLDNDRWTIEHEPKATNATVFDDHAIHRHLLTPGDVIQMGLMKLVFEERK